MPTGGKEDVHLEWGEVFWFSVKNELQQGGEGGGSRAIYIPQLLLVMDMVMLLQVMLLLDMLLPDMVVFTMDKKRMIRY